jgi:protein TonB
MPTAKALRDLARPAAIALITGAFTFHAAASADIAPVNKVEPEFPREAYQAGAEHGKVRARMTVDGSGEVKRVEIMEATPRRLFDRAVVKSLSQWRYAPGSDGRLVEVEIDFHR